MYSTSVIWPEYIYYVFVDSSVCQLDIVGGSCTYLHEYMDLISTHIHVPDFCTADVTAMITDLSEYALSCLSMQRE